MPDYRLSIIAAEINRRANSHPIGSLQNIRMDLKGLERLPAKTIFTSLTTFEDYAFHHGGRSELQFNIGIEEIDSEVKLRYGIAFSLETSQTLPRIDVLIPKVKLFNDFLQLYNEKYSDMRMWHYRKNTRSQDYFPNVVLPELVKNGVFIFLGKRQPINQLDYDLILNDLDRLLPIYKYVESDGNLPPISAITVTPFEFRPGHSERASLTVASQAQKQLDINLRHNILQGLLYRKLLDKYGVENVGTENQSGSGTNIDLVVKQNKQYWFYEIKTASSSRACMRQALGQLLEYAFWPGSIEATRLIIVGEPPLNSEGETYIQRLKERFSIPIDYEQIIVKE